MNGKLRRSRTMKTNIDVVGRGLLLVCLLRAVHAASETDSDEAVFEQMESAIYAVLFPWFVQIIGVLAYYIISRYAHFVPSTAAMFIVGALIGFAVPRMEAENDVTSSAATWIGMEGKVLLLVFFPGLMFLEAYSVDFVLFVEAIWQILWLAFPMVLAGTILTALVANFMFDYGWSFDLCMTFGGILSATDPVAISILMKELGAPARLQVSASHS
jgi:NhaP-type Na+/H+ or K+/H+ antiporter